MIIHSLINAGLGLIPTVPDMATRGALAQGTRDAAWAAQGVYLNKVAWKRQLVTLTQTWRWCWLVALIRHVIINQGSQEEEQRSIQKPSKKSPIPLAEKVGPATKTGLDPPAGLHPPPTLILAEGRKTRRASAAGTKGSIPSRGRGTTKTRTG